MTNRNTYRSFPDISILVMAPISQMMIYGPQMCIKVAKTPCAMYSHKILKFYTCNLKFLLYLSKTTDSFNISMVTFQNYQTPSSIEI